MRTKTKIPSGTKLFRELNFAVILRELIFAIVRLVFLVEYYINISRLIGIKALSFFFFIKLHVINEWTRFVLFWAFETPWLSMAFSMIFPRFPWAMLSSCSQSIVKTIYYLRYFPTLWRIKCVLGFIFFNWNWLVLRLVCCFFNFDFVCLFSLRKFVTFPWLSMTHTSISGLSRPGNWWNYKIPWLSRFSTTRTNPGETTCRDVKHGNQCHSLTIKSCPSVTYCSYNGSAITTAPLDALSHL